ncbi:hypothetical protein BH11MYX1_BH11MYX1_49830 [soil metagenome]
MDVERHRKAAVARVLEGDGRSSTTARRAAFEAPSSAPDAIRALLVKVAEGAYKITDEDLVAVKALVGEDEIFELVVAAAMGKASRQLAAAEAAILEVG